MKNPFRAVRIWKTDSLDGSVPSKNYLEGEFIIHPDPERQKQTNPEYGLGSDPEVIHRPLLY